MANPKTIEELLKMKPTPVELDKMCTFQEYSSFDANFREAAIGYVKTYYKEFGCGNGYMLREYPPSYYHLPPDKQLGLPLGEWSSTIISKLADLLPFGVVHQYCNNAEIAIDCGIKSNGKSLQLNDFGKNFKWFEIKKQPPNLYNPLDQQAEEVPAEQPAKETVKMELPWQDISTLKHKGKWVLAFDGKDVSYHYSRNGFDSMESLKCSAFGEDEKKYTHWLPITAPETPTVEAPVEPETITSLYQAVIARELWYYEDFGDLKHIVKQGDNWTQEQCDKIAYRFLHELFITATDPTAYLAWLAEQETKEA